MTSAAFIFAARDVHTRLLFGHWCNTRACSAVVREFDTYEAACEAGRAIADREGIRHFIHNDTDGDLW